MPNGVRRSAPSTTCCRFFRGSRKFKAAAASPHVWTSSVRGRTQSQHAPARRGLTPPSSRAPTAKHQARATVQRIICSAGLAFFCWCRLMSNVRPRSEHKLMLSPAPSPALLNASLRPRSWSRCAPATSATSSGKEGQSLAQAARFGRLRQPSRQSECASRQQPTRNPRPGQFQGQVHLSQALRARRFMSQVLAHLAQVQGSSFVVRQGLGLWQVAKSARSGYAWPNPSLKLSPNSKTPGPRSGSYHHPQRGPGVLLSVPA